MLSKAMPCGLSSWVLIEVVKEAVVISKFVERSNWEILPLNPTSYSRDPSLSKTMPSGKRSWELIEVAKDAGEISKSVEGVDGERSAERVGEREGGGS